MSENVRDDCWIGGHDFRVTGRSTHPHHDPMRKDRRLGGRRNNFWKDPTGNANRRIGFADDGRQDDAW